MPYVPPELKERIKREVSIQRLAEARGIKLRRSGKELIGLCPFHQDRNPSLNIDPVKNVWHCKGACGEGGDVIEWVKRAEGISFTHAVELLKRNYLPSAASTAEPPPKISTVPKLPPLFQANVDDQKLLGIVVDYRNVTTSYGVNGFNDSHREAFQKHGTRRVYIAYDRDEAGACHLLR